MLCSCDLAVGGSPSQTLDVMVATLTSVPLHRVQLLSLLPKCMLCCSDVHYYWEVTRHILKQMFE